MALRIRLRRIGRKKQPSYRIVVADGDSPRDGAYVDAVGFYNPRTQPATLELDLERVDNWLGKGASMSTTTASLVRKARKGGDTAVAYTPKAEALAAAHAKEPARAARQGVGAGKAEGVSTAELTPPPVAEDAAAAPDADVSADAAAEELKGAQE